MDTRDIIGWYFVLKSAKKTPHFLISKTWIFLINTSHSLVNLKYKFTLSVCTIQTKLTHSRYSIPLVIFTFIKYLALLQDFTPIEGGWSTAASLCSIICQCCDGAKLQASLEFNQTFLPNVLDNMLNLSFKIQEVYLATEVRCSGMFLCTIQLFFKIA